MDYKVSSKDYPSASWEDIRTQHKKNKKVKRVTLRARGRKKPVRDFWKPVRSIIGFFFKLIIFAGCGYAFYTFFLILTTSSQFAVNEITIVGNQSLDQKQLHMMIDQIPGQNIFTLDLEDVTNALVQHVWIRSVSAKKVYPQKLEVGISERRPYSRIQLDKVYVMDNYGVLLDQDAPKYKKLPLIVQRKNDIAPKLGHNIAGEGVIQSLKTMHYFNRLPFFRSNPLIRAEIDDQSRITFFTNKNKLKVFMTLNRITESFKNFMIMLETLDRKIDEIEHIDLSFKNQVVVKHRS